MERIIHSPFSKEKLDFELTPNEEGRYFDLVRLAEGAKAYPSQSGFFVRTAGLAEDGELCLGGNKEHAHSDAFIHGETAVLSSLKDLTDSPIEAIAWYKERKGEEIVGPGDFGRPCGNCRDVLIKYTSPDLILLQGNQTGIVYTHLKDFMFENFDYLDPSLLHEKHVEEALIAQEAAIDVYLPDYLKGNVYGAALVAEDGTIWRGSLYSNAGYDAVTPVLSAILYWKNSYPAGEISESHLNLSRVVIVGKEEIPSPFYRDRQALLELDEILRKYWGENNSLEIQLVNVNGRGISAQKTDARESLPHPFTPGEFRMDDVIFGELAKLIGTQNAKKVFERGEK